MRYQKPAFREVINCELFTCFDKCSPQVQTWLKRRTSLATLYHDQNAGSPWLRPILPPPPALRPGLPFWIVKTWPKLTSLHFFVWKKRLHRVQITFECTTDSVWNIYIYVQKSLRLFMTSFFLYSFSSSSALSWLWLSWLGRHLQMTTVYKVRFIQRRLGNCQASKYLVIFSHWYSMGNSVSSWFTLYDM